MYEESVAGITRSLATLLCGLYEHPVFLVLGMR